MRQPLQFAIALGVLTCLLLGAGDALAEGSTQGVTEGDLPLMVLPLDALPDEYADLEINNESGFDDPGDTPEPDVINAYGLAYGDPDSDRRGVGTVVALFTSASAATDLVADEIEHFGDYREVETFPVADLGDGATGIVGRADFGDEKITEVIFTLGPLAAAAGALRYDDADVRAQVEEMARALFDRMKGVLLGDVTETTALLPPDVNCDSQVNSVDAALILQLDARLVSSLRCGVLADASRDGTINSIDAALILQLIGGWPARPAATVDNTSRLPP